MSTHPQHPSTVEYLEILRQYFQRDTERCLAAAPICLTPRRTDIDILNEDTSRAEQAAADADADAAAARDDAAAETDLF